MSNARPAPLPHPTESGPRAAPGHGAGRGLVKYLDELGQSASAASNHIDGLNLNLERLKDSTNREWCLPAAFPPSAARPGGPPDPTQSPPICSSCEPAHSRAQSNDQSPFDHDAAPALFYFIATTEYLPHGQDLDEATMRGRYTGGHLHVVIGNADTDRIRLPPHEGQEPPAVPGSSAATAIRDEHRHAETDSGPPAEHSHVETDSGPPARNTRQARRPE